MGKCVVLINKIAGGYSGAGEAKRIARLKEMYSEVEVAYIPGTVPDFSGAEAIVVQGGDGTLNHLINSEVPNNASVYYLPGGTLNEVAHARGNAPISVVSEGGGKLFSYVLASGTFTPLGYIADVGSKQRLKVFAYIFKVLKEYKVWRMRAEITADGKTDAGEYTLIMAINSPRCFGFNFNRLYTDGGKMCLLTIKAPKARGLLGKIAIFFPFFRAFFIGFNREYSSETMTFKPFDKLSLKFESVPVFCADGEKVDDMPHEFDINKKSLSYKIRIGFPEKDKKIDKR